MEKNIDIILLSRLQIDAIVQIFTEFESRQKDQSFVQKRHAAMDSMVLEIYKTNKPNYLKSEATEADASQLFESVLKYIEISKGWVFIPMLTDLLTLDEKPELIAEEALPIKIRKVRGAFNDAY